MGRDRGHFSIDIGLHQGYVRSPLIFIIVMDELIRGIQDELPWCMLFTDDIVLIDKTRDGVNSKLKRWRTTLDSKGFRAGQRQTIRNVSLVTRRTKQEGKSPL